MEEYEIQHRALVRRQETYVVEKIQETDSTDSDEFEDYAIAVEKDINIERKLTLRTLKYIHQVLPPAPTDTTNTEAINMANLTLLNSEDATDSDCSIILSAIQDGNVKLLRQFLRDLQPSRREQLLKSTVNAKGGASFLQLALDYKNREVFRELRINMDRETKREVTQIKDKQRNTALHDACFQNDLQFVASLLANFTSEERPELIMTRNRLGNSCLHMAAVNDEADVFLCLLNQFKCDEVLWESIMMANNSGIPVGSWLVSKTKAHNSTMFRKLCNIVQRLGKLEEFFLQPQSKESILHGLVTAATTDPQEVEYVLENLTLIMNLADSVDCKCRLLWKRSERPPLYRLALGTDQELTSKIGKVLLSHVSRMDRVHYIMATEINSQQNSLHAAAKVGNVKLLRCLVNYLSYDNKQTVCLKKGSATGQTPLHIAAGDSLHSFNEILNSLNVDERHTLIQTREKRGNTPILTAFIEGNIEVVNSLMKEQWMPKRMVFPLMSARNNAGWTIIHMSCVRLVGDTLTSSVLAFLKNVPGTNMKALITHVDSNGNTVLHLAALLYRPSVITSLMKYLPRSEHKRMLLKQNNDGLVASQLCNMPDLVVVKYLQPLKEVGWTDFALVNKRDFSLRKSETQRKLMALERENGIRPTTVHLDTATTDLDSYDFDV